MKINNREKILLCLIITIEAIFCFTTLGSIPVGPIVATLSMIPVIITTLTFGLIYGLIIGFMFGLFSFLVWTFFPPNPAMAFLFTPFYNSLGYNGNFGSLIICFIPRILIPVSTFITYRLLINNKKISMFIASFVGSFTNTILVMFFILLFFGKEYEILTNQSIFKVILITICTNGIIEAIISCLICPFVSNSLIRFIKNTYIN